HLHYVELRGGASKPATIDTSDAVLFLTGSAPVLLDHVNIVDSKHFGLGLKSEQKLADGSNSVFLDKTVDGPVFVASAASLEGFPSLLVGCDPGPGLLVEQGAVKHTTMWVTQPVPFLFRTTNLAVNQDGQLPTLLTIAAPNKLLFGVSNSVSVGDNGGVPANLV